MKFSIVVHAHQPPDNYDSVFEEGLERSYGPFFNLLEAMPEVRISAHFSGSLLEWLERHQPAFVRQFRRLVDRGQVELVAAGMQEPVLALLPEHDRANQVLAHRAYLRRLFGADATVGWLTERVWTPEIAQDLAKAGIEAVALDEGHFIAAGLRLEDLTGPFTTEWLGHRLTLMPASDAMRFSIPWEPVPKVLRDIRRLARAGDHRIVAFTDDLEKFGMWPTTFEKVWKQNWMRQFLEGLLAMRNVEVVPLGEALAAEPPGPRVYLPDGSYPEMLHWSMTPRAQRELAATRKALERAHLWDRTAPLIRTGLYFQYLSKYPEANYFHKRMLDVSERVAKTHSPASVTRHLDPPPEAVRQLWRAQANCPYWHGWFGGTYLPLLRQQVFRSLLRAENALEAAGERRRLLRVFDLDADGTEEALVTSEQLVVSVAPADGGAVVELSDRARAVNLADTIARRLEVYHDADDPPYVPDRGRRGVFVDRFLAPGAPPGRRGDIEDLGDFSGLPYTMRAATRRGEAHIELKREAEAPGGRVRVEKTLTVSDDGGALRASYRLTGLEGTVAARFATEANFGICFPQHLSGRLDAGSKRLDLKRGGATRGIESCTLVLDDPKIAAHLTTSVPADLDARPLTTMSRSERGLEENQQALTCLLSWPVRLAPGETFEVSLQLTVGAPPRARRR
ncbi:MAG: alpha-amylase/4-alpha-glucanotransferase domain-containing protein [Dehalococcoidia bacterium]